MPAHVAAEDPRRQPDCRERNPRRRLRRRELPHQGESKHLNSVSEIMNFAFENKEYCTKNREFLCIKNKAFCIQNDGFPRSPSRTSAILSCASNGRQLMSSGPGAFTM